MHLLTVNRYLAERDAAFASPLHQFLGLTCGLVTEAVPLEARRAAYRSQITVAVNKDIAFDYMRDRLASRGAFGNARRKVAALLGQGPAPLLRGLYDAIIDEADSVLIDEARTPLILAMDSNTGRHPPAVFDRALALCDQLVPAVDYARIEGERRTVLLPPGQARLDALCRVKTPLLARTSPGRSRPSAST